jgi:hypothetical protein
MRKKRQVFFHPKVAIFENSEVLWKEKITKTEMFLKKYNSSI